MRKSTAFLAGAGTVVVAIAMGLGGGLLVANIVSPHQPKAEMTKVEQQRRSSSEQPIQASNAPAERVPYLEATKDAAINPVVVNPAPQSQSQQPAEQPKQEADKSGATQAAAQPAVAQPQAQANASAQAAPSAAQAAPSQQPSNQQQAAASPQQNAAPQNAAPEDALAKAHNADLNSATPSRRELRRAERERRRAERREQWAERRQQWGERRQQWVERHKLRQRPDDDLGEVERTVRAETDQPGFIATEPARAEMPRIRLFGDDD